MLGKLLTFSDRFFEPTPVYAHCDVPCGIYETDTLRHCVETVRSMTDKLLALGEIDSLHKQNDAVRMITTKEEFAQKAKHEILVLWTDYFKPQHLEKWPDLHDKIWKATKLCSDVKRDVSKEKVAALEKAAEDIAKIFAESKK